MRPYKKISNEKLILIALHQLLNLTTGSGLIKREIEYRVKENG